MLVLTCSEKDRLLEMYCKELQGPALGRLCLGVCSIVGTNVP